MAGGGGRGGGSRCGHGGRGTGNDRGANYQQHQSGGDSGQGGRGGHTQMANNPPSVQKLVNRPVQGQEGANRLPVAGPTSSVGATAAWGRGGTWSDVVARNGAPPPQPQPQAATEIATEIDIPVGERQPLLCLEDVGKDKVVPMKRPDCGGTHALKRFPLLVNHFPVRFDQTTNIWHNEVDITQEVSSKGWLQDMNLVMKENPSRHRISFGQSSYPREYKSGYDLRCGVAALRGFQLSLKPTTQGLSLCLDYSVVALCKRMPVIDNLKENIPGFQEVHDIWGKIGNVTKAPPPQPQPQPQPQAATEIDIPASLSLFVSGSSALKFNGLNYTDWSEQIYSTLNVMNLDIAIVSDEKPAAITETSSEDDKSIYGAWERSNMLSLYLMEMTMAENIKPSMPKTEDAREFMRKVKEYSQSDLADKSTVGNLMDELTTKKFDWSKPIHDHVTAMSNLAGKLKTMGIDVSDTFLVQFIKNSLPAEFGLFQMNYNTMKDKWNFKKFKAMLVLEEGRLKKMKDHSIHLTFYDGASSSKFKPGKRNKGKKSDKTPIKVSEGQINEKKIRCFFCNKEGHVKVDCPKRKEWFEKKCTYYADLVAYRGRMYHDAMMERQSCGSMLT